MASPSDSDHAASASAVREVSSFQEVGKGAQYRVRRGDVSYDLGFVDDVFSYADEYIVYFCNGTITNVADPSPIGALFNTFYGEYMRAESIPVYGLSDEEKRQYRRKLAMALETAIAPEQDTKNASLMLTAASEFAESCARRRLSKPYLIAASVVAALGVVPGVILADSAWSAVPTRSLQCAFSYGLIGGSLGALFSVLADRSGRSSIPLDADPRSAGWHAFFRILAGIVGSTIVAFAVMGGVLGAEFNDGTSGDMRCVFLCVAAGFSERFAVSVIDKVASKG